MSNDQIDNVSLEDLKKFNKNLLDSCNTFQIKDRDRSKENSLEEMLKLSRWVENKGRHEYFGHRKTWSEHIVKWITLLIAFNMILTVGVGSGIFNFEKYKWFISIVTAETFLQIVGLGYVAAHFLFSDKHN